MCKLGEFVNEPFHNKQNPIYLILNANGKKVYFSLSNNFPFYFSLKNISGFKNLTNKKITIQLTSMRILVKSCFQF